MPIPYRLLCALLGFGLGWLPMLVHGAIPQQFNLLYISRCGRRVRVLLRASADRLPRGDHHLAGFVVLARPMCGLLMLFPLTLISLAMPGCGWP